MIVEGSVVDFLAAFGAAIVIGVVLVAALVEIRWSRRRRCARSRIAARRAARARQGEFLGVPLPTVSCSGAEGSRALIVMPPEAARLPPRLRANERAHTIDADPSP